MALCVDATRLKLDAECLGHGLGLGVLRFGMHRLPPRPPSATSPIEVVRLFDRTTKSARSGGPVGEGSGGRRVLTAPPVKGLRTVVLDTGKEKRKKGGEKRKGKEDETEVSGL